MGSIYSTSVFQNELVVNTLRGFTWSVGKATMAVRSCATFETVAEGFGPIFEDVPATLITV